MPSNANDPTIELARLSAVRDRQVCCIAQFHLPAEDESRLKNMGLCVGRHVEVLQFGDPLIVKVSGTNVGIARRLATGIEVRMCIESDGATSRRTPSESSASERIAPLEAVAIA